MKTLFRILLISLTLFSCNGQRKNEQKKIQESNIVNKSDDKINFFDKKYFNGYNLIIDESNISDHPIFTYLNCEKEGYFSVHFIPKDPDLIEYWKNKHYENIDLSTIDLEKDKIRINKKLGSNFQNYNVFAYLIKSQFIDANGNCSEESTFCKKNSIAEVYLYNQNVEKWELQKKIKSDILPQIHNNDFFVKNFSNLLLKNDLELKYETPKGFYVLNSIDVNLKLNSYKILTLEKNEIKNKENAQHNSNQIVILQEKDNSYYKILENKKIIFGYDDNCPADGFGGIVSKNSYFTVQQIFCQDFLFVKSFSTFFIDENSGNIKLYKYGEEFTDRSNPDKLIPTLVWTKNDFGEIKFENVSEDFLSKLRQKKPKK